MHPHGGQQRALSDQQSVSLVHFHLLLISQEPPSCSATPAVTSSNSRFCMAAGFPIGRDAVMSRYINKLIKQNACGLLFRWCARITDTHTHTHNCQCLCAFFMQLNCPAARTPHHARCEKSLHVFCAQVHVEPKDMTNSKLTTQNNDNFMFSLIFSNI